MIMITNIMKDFIEVQEGPLYVYGAGNNGYHVGCFLNRCEITWSGYIDQKCYPQGTVFHEHPILSKDEFVARYKGGSPVRLLITPVNYQSILEELLWMDHKHNINAVCLVPVYDALIQQGESYNINKCLAYFRNKLFVGDIPTIISNDCAGGMIYNIMDMLMLSPIVNVGMNPSDFIKFCKNPSYYLDFELDENSLYYTKTDFPDSNDKVLSGKIGDITIKFAHMRLNEKPAERWNVMRKKINWKRIIYVIREPLPVNGSIPLKVKQEFMKLEGKKLFYSMKSSAYCDGISSFYMPIDLVFIRSTPIETYFDLLEWLND